MALTWRKSAPSDDINELIARKNYRKATEMLEAQLHADRKNAYVRQQLADVYVLAGEKRRGVQLLNALADDFARDGFAAKSIAVLKKIQRLEPGRVDVDAKLANIINMRDAEQQSIQARRGLYRGKLQSLDEYQPELAEGPKDATEPVSAVPSPVPFIAPTPEDRDEVELEIELEDGHPQEEWETETSQDAAAEESAAKIPNMATTPLFSSFSADELVSLIQGFRLLSYEPGDIVVTEGAPGDSLFIITSGNVKAFVRGRDGSYRKVRDMGDGDFFGEISLLTGSNRTATVTAASHCELLELDKAAVDSVTSTHPKVLETLQKFSDSRVRSDAENLVSGPSGAKG
ncbi:MAG TPA: cyclic nucleotide-binding domain-containing protein [Thermoanaerobaculia bacterium]|nr:cyclic nucleotide-binding domain-containing protein [Thermoanaerobaculia bacterium]